MIYTAIPQITLQSEWVMLCTHVTPYLFGFVDVWGLFH